MHARVSGTAAPLELSFESLEALCDWYAKLVVEGRAELPHALAPGVEVPAVLQVPDELPLGATLVEQGHALSITCSPALQERIFQNARRKRVGHRTSEAQGRRQHDRYETLLKVRFRSYQSLIDEYVVNISKGGLFVRTQNPPPLGTIIQLGVTFPDGALHAVDAEVVRVVTPAEAVAIGGLSGIGVRVLGGAPEFEGALDGLLAMYVRRRPRALVIDDDRFFLRALADALLLNGFEVAVAPGGMDGAHALVQHFYELDAVVVDLNMAGLDGRSLMQRVRRLSSELRLRIVLISGAPDDVLQSLVGPDGAHAYVSKNQPLPNIAEALKHAISG